MKLAFRISWCPRFSQGRISGITINLAKHLIFIKQTCLGCATCFICIEWWGKGWPMVVCPFRALVILYRMLPIFTLYEISNSWATVSTIGHLPRMFQPKDFLFEKRIGLVSTDLLYIIFTCYIQDNQQEGFRPSNWFLWCLGPCMNHLPPLWWSYFRLMFLNESRCVNLT